VTGAKEPKIHTASNSTMEPDENLHNLMDNKKTTRLYGHLKDQRPVMINSKVLTLDDARAIITADFSMVNDNWKQSAPKKVVSTYIVVFCHVCTVFAGPAFISI